MDHPFWGEAVEMRLAHRSIGEILARARRLGHDDLTYSMISEGLRGAPVDLHLPAVAHRWLRRRYEEAARDFNAFAIMRDLSCEALSKIAELEEAVSDPDISSSERLRRERELWRWYGRAFDWAERCSNLAVRVQGVDVMRVYAEGAAARADRSREEDRASLEELIERVSEEFRRRLPPGFGDHEISERYGASNIRPVGAVIDGDAVVFDDEDE